MKNRGLNPEAFTVEIFKFKSITNFWSLVFYDKKST